MNSADAANRLGADLRTCGVCSQPFLTRCGMWVGSMTSSDGQTAAGRFLVCSLTCGMAFADANTIVHAEVMTQLFRTQLATRDPLHSWTLTELGKMQLADEQADGE